MAKTRILLKGDIVDTAFFPTRIGLANRFVRRVKKNSLERQYADMDIREELPQTDCIHAGAVAIRSVMFDISHGAAITKNGTEKLINNIKVVSVVYMPYMSVCDFGVVVRENIYSGTFGEVVFDLNEKFRKSRLIFVGISSEDFSHKNRILLTADSFYYIPENLGSAENAEKIIEELLIKIVRDYLYYSNFIEFFKIFSSIAQAYGLIKGAYSSSEASAILKGVDFTSIHSVLGVMI